MLREYCGHWLGMPSKVESLRQIELPGPGHPSIIGSGGVRRTYLKPEACDVGPL